MMHLIARLRVPLGFVCGALSLWLARPTAGSIALGMVIAIIGEAIRFWAAGHIEKGREVTRSGPYRFVRHPLYLGSAIMGIGLIWAAQNPAVTLISGIYLSVTLAAAMFTEEAALTKRFGSDYAAYRARRPLPGSSRDASPIDRPFSLARAIGNREHRAAAGLLVAGALLYLRSRI